MQFKVTTPPATEPATLAETKSALRIDHSDEDAEVERAIASAREYLEGYMGRPIVTQTITGATDRFSAYIALKPGVQSVESIKYTDEDGAEQTVDPSVYEVDTFSLGGGVFLSYDKEWPTPRGDRFSVRVEFVAGYGGQVDVPSKVKSAVILIAGDLLNNRENSAPIELYEIPMSAKSLVSAEVPMTA